jgi:nicotinate-nucleotide pyrophosphorylase (carboxylating)
MQKFILDASEELILKNPAYKKAVEFYVWQAYLNDAGHGDITTELFVSDKIRLITAEIMAKEAGILAGIQEAEWFLKKLGISIISNKKDGSELKKDDVIMRLSGRADKILACERTLLNLLQRMSGVATATNNLVKKVPKPIRILATRKTLWGDLDKRAVSIGGGATHRLNLADAVLIKDNHIALSDNLGESFSGLRKAKNIRFIEIEFDDLNQVKIFAKHFKVAEGNSNIIVMLDNFIPSEIKKAVVVLKKTGVLIEVSGGINEKNIKEYAIKGVSAISSGAITNKADSLDISLDI